jgi:hypothetical protein
MRFTTRLQLGPSHPQSFHLITNGIRYEVIRIQIFIRKRPKIFWVNLENVSWKVRYAFLSSEEKLVDLELTSVLALLLAVGKHILAS